MNSTMAPHLCALEFCLVKESASLAEAGVESFQVSLVGFGLYWVGCKTQLKFFNTLDESAGTVVLVHTLTVYLSTLPSSFFRRHG